MIGINGATIGEETNSTISQLMKNSRILRI